MPVPGNEDQLRPAGVPSRLQGFWLVCVWCLLQNLWYWLQNQNPLCGHHGPERRCCLRYFVVFYIVQLFRLPNRLQGLRLVCVRCLHQVLRDWL